MLGTAGRCRGDPKWLNWAEMSAPPLTLAGRLSAVTDGTAGDPPATALERQQIAHWRMVGRYTQETIAALAELLLGEKAL
jgi:hypothetical protein